MVINNDRYILRLLVTWNFFQCHYSLQRPIEVILIQKLFSKNIATNQLILSAHYLPEREFLYTFDEFVTVYDDVSGLDFLQRRHQGTRDASLEGGVTGRVDNS